MVRCLKACLGVLCVPMLFTIGGVELIHTAVASCTLTFDVNQPTCDVCASDQTFAYDMDTSWVSDGKCQWTVAFNLANPDGGIVDHELLKDSDDVDDNCGFDVGVIDNAVTGKKTGIGNRTSVFIAIEDSETPECGGNRNVTIKTAGSSCP